MPKRSSIRETRNSGVGKGRIESGWGWTVLAVLAISAATLSPAPYWSGSGSPLLQSLIPSTLSDWFDVIQNALLFMPLGIARAVAGASALSIAITGAVLSTAVELTQSVIPGRDPSARDVIANTLGAVLGWYCLVTPPMSRWLSIGIQTASRWAAHLATPGGSTLSFAWALIICSVVSLPGWLLTGTPPNSPYEFPGADMDSAALQPVRIGSENTPDSFFTGVIDEVRIYDRARDANLIRADMQFPVNEPRQDTPDLIAAYAFDAREGEVARDESGRHHDATIHGATWIAQGRFGSALRFDGHSAEVVIPPSPDLDFRDEMTLEAWIQPDTQVAPEPAVVSRPRAYLLSGLTDQGRFLPRPGSHFGERWEDAQPLRPIPTGQWTHLAVSYDGQTIRTFINGSLAASNRRWSQHRITSFELNGIELVDRPRYADDDIKRAILNGIDLRATIRCGALDERVLPFFAIVGPGDITALGLSATRTDILLDLATRVSRFDVPAPQVRIPGALAMCRSNDRLEFVLAGRMPNFHATLNGRQVTVVTPGPGTAWAFLLHSELMPWRIEAALTFVWIALVIYPFALGARARGATVAGIVLLLATTALLRGSTRAPDLWDASAAVAGCLAAGIYRWRVNHRARRC